MKNRKWIALALAAAMVGSLTACGGGSGTTETTAAAADTTAAAAADTTAADAQAPAGDGTGLVYWSMWESTEPQGQVIKEAVDKFSADTGVAVDVQFKGRTGIREGLQPALDAGTNIDLFDEDIDRVNTTWGAYLMDLEELAKASDYDATANASLMEACREVGGGTLKSIPYQPNVFAFFYNKAIFEEAGVTAVPATWAELDAACQKIKDAGYTPITCDDAYILCLFGYHMSRLNGYDKTSDIVKNNKWDDPSVMETAKAYADFAQKGYFSEYSIQRIPGGTEPGTGNGNSSHVPQWFLASKRSKEHGRRRLPVGMLQLPGSGRRNRRSGSSKLRRTGAGYQQEFTECRGCI